MPERLERVSFGGAERSTGERRSHRTGQIRRAFGILLVSLLAAGLVGGGLLWRWSNQLRGDAEGYAREATEATIRSWDPDAFRRMASQELLARTPPDAMASYFKFLSEQLGTLVAVRSVETAGWSLRFRPSPVAAVTVNVRAEFAKGSAVLTWLLVNEGRAWKVVMLRADSDQIKLPGS